MRLDGRVAVVTGAARGIGRAIAERLAADGAKVALADVDVERAREAATTIGASAVAVLLDVRSWDSIEGAAAMVEERLGPVDALVNNAGISRVARSEELPRAWWDDVVDVNLTGTWRCCQALGAPMVSRGFGAIVNLGSAYSEIGAAGRAAYAATKTGVIGLTRVLGTEWAGRGVRVNAVQPGYIDTPMVQVSLHAGSIDVEQVLDRVPIGRLGKGEEVAAAVAFLLSDEARYITASTLRIDGGHLAYGGLPPAGELPQPVKGVEL